MPTRGQGQSQQGGGIAPEELDRALQQFLEQNGVNIAQITPDVMDQLREIAMRVARGDQTAQQELMQAIAPYQTRQPQVPQGQQGGMQQGGQQGGQQATNGQGMASYSPGYQGETNQGDIDQITSRNVNDFTDIQLLDIVAGKLDEDILDNENTEGMKPTEYLAAVKEAAYQILVTKLEGSGINTNKEETPSYNPAPQGQQGGMYSQQPPM